MIPAGEADAGSAGGALAQDVGSQDDLTRAIDDPEGHDRVTKQDDIDHGQARPADLADRTASGDRPASTVEHPATVWAQPVEARALRQAARHRAKVVPAGYPQ